jgi:hypothetical protein
MKKKTEQADSTALAQQLAADTEDLLSFLIPIYEYLNRPGVEHKEPPARPYARRCERCGVPLECGDRCGDCLAGAVG